MAISFRVVKAKESLGPFRYEVLAAVEPTLGLPVIEFRMAAAPNRIIAIVIQKELTRIQRGGKADGH